MRGLFVVLLLANLLLFGWGYTRDVSLLTEEIPVPPPIGSLRLVAELSADELAALPRVATIAAEPPKPGLPLDTPELPSTKEPESAVSQPSVPQDEAKGVPQAVGVAEEAPVASPTVTVTPKEASPPKPDASPTPPKEKGEKAKPAQETLKQQATTNASAPQKGPSAPKVSAKESDQRERVAELPPVKAAEEKRRSETSSGTVERPLPSGCGFFGPTTNRSNLADILADLMQQGVSASVHERKRDQVVYGVTTPTIITTGEAQRVMVQLQSRGFRNLALIRSEDGRQYVSLGEYPTQRDAEQFADRMRGAGFSAEVRARQDGRTDYWLEFSFRAEVAPETDAWKALKGRYGALGPTRRACGTVPGN